MNRNKNNTSPRLLVVLAGDIVKDPETTIKYKIFIEALGRRFPVMDVFNAKLRGLRQIINALPVWHPVWQTWSERASKNVSAFVARSKKASRWVCSMQDQADAVIQLGVLFDVTWTGIELPNIIYTDYTAHLSALRKDAGRSPLKGQALKRWLELEGQAMRRSAQVCVRSDLVGRSVIEDYNLPDEKLSVIGGGMNLQAIPPLVSRPHNEHSRILFIGLDYYRKGGDLVIKAFASLRDSAPNAELLFVTESPIPDHMPLERVKVISPVWDREAFVNLYREADIFVLPSRLETWGDVILEAMAYGLPCIGVYGQSMQEIIRNGETGLLVPPEDIPSLANAMLVLLKDRELRTRLGMAGYRLVTSEFTWDRVVERLSPIILRATNGRRENQPR